MLFAFCIETSHGRGMGHLFRTICVAKGLLNLNHKVIVFLNTHEPSLEYLKNENINFYDIKDFENFKLNLSHYIKKYDVDIWINDRLNTEEYENKIIKSFNIPLISFDDQGSGSPFCDLNIVALDFYNRGKFKGKKVLYGPKYLVLNPEIKNVIRHRTELQNIVVTLGGTDTYETSFKVVEKLKLFPQKITLIIGPGFKNKKALRDLKHHNLIVKENVPSLIQEFKNKDLAITGGGITAFEAVASGLPTIIIASETFEIDVGKYLSNLGVAIYSGFRNKFGLPNNIDNGSIKIMSKLAINKISCNGLDEVIREILEL